MKISVIGLWRDAENYIEKSLKNIESLFLSQNIDFDFYFYENDSKDNTKNILDEWMLNKKGKILSEKLNFPKYGSVVNIQRLVLLSYYRNKLLGMVEKADSDYVLMIDTDILFKTSDLTELLNCIKKIDTCVMTVANVRQPQIPDFMLNETSDSFYDVFALRDKYNNNGLYFTDCPLLLKEDRDKWKNQEPIRILSGFSGFSLIKTEILKKCRWSTSSHSEHINFCLDVNRYGEIYIVPKSTPTAQVDLSVVSIEKCKEVGKQQIQIVENLNQIYYFSISNQLTNGQSNK
jgi:hypothetical protein